MNPPTRERAARVAWLAGTRGEVLLLAPAFAALHRTRTPEWPGWLFCTGEHGMAATQALDFLGVIPDEFAELCHPADESVVRLNQMLGRIEAFLRQRKATRAVFAGYGPTAAAAALYCHARRCPGLWLRTPDPAGLIPRQHWEAGLARIIEACAPLVEIREIEAMPIWDAAPAGENYGATDSLNQAFPARRAGAPLALVAVLRREWGIANDVTDRLARELPDWARARPGTDWLVLSNLNARFEGPLRAMREQPENLILAPPLPYLLYRAALAEASFVLTDSPLIAAEALALGVPVAALGEATAASDEKNLESASVLSITPGDFDNSSWIDRLPSALAAVPPAQSSLAPEAFIRDWLNAAR